MPNGPRIQGSNMIMMRRNRIRQAQENRNSDNAIQAPNHTQNQLSSSDRTHETNHDEIAGFAYQFYAASEFHIRDIQDDIFPEALTQQYATLSCVSQWIANDNLTNTTLPTNLSQAQVATDGILSLYYDALERYSINNDTKQLFNHSCADYIQKSISQIQEKILEKEAGSLNIGVQAQTVHEQSQPSHSRTDSNTSSDSQQQANNELSHVNRLQARKNMGRFKTHGV